MPAFRQLFGPHTMTSISYGLGTAAAPQTALLFGQYASASASSESIADLQGNASVTLNSNLSGLTAQTATGQFTLAFAQAVQSATTVDPATGHRELLAGANAQLAGTLNNLLVQNGFGTDQAQAITANLSQQLAQGGTINLLAGFAQVSGQSTSSSQSYYGNATSASSVSSVDRSGAIALSLNLDTGELNVALSETVTTYSASSQSQSRIQNIGAGSAQGIGLPSLSGDTGVATADYRSAQDKLIAELTPLLYSALALTTGIGLGQSATQQSFLGVPAAAAGTGVSAYSGAPLPSAAASGANDNGGLAESETDVYAAEQIVALGRETVVAAGSVNAGTGVGDSSGATAQGTASRVEAGASSISGGSGGTSSSAAALSGTAQVQGDASYGGFGQLLGKLGTTTLHGEADTTVANLLRLSAAAQQASAGSDRADASRASVVTLSIGFSQTLALRQLDANGYGTTLYQRLDGGLGSATSAAVQASA